MCETGKQSARLVGPFSGEISVNSNSPISIRFEGEDLDPNNIYVSLSGERAIIKGQEAKGYEIMEIVKNQKYVYIKFRKIGGLDKKEIFVFGKCGNCFTREQRFFVSGACTKNNGGILFHEYNNTSGRWIHKSSAQITIHENNLVPDNNKLRIVHSEIKDAPIRDWNRIFITDDVHLWWSDDFLITRINFCIFRKKSEDILWTKEDIGVDKIESVRPIGKYSVIINEKKRVNYSIIEVLDI